jgi:hypothetical protein
MSGGEEALEAGWGIGQCRVVVVESVAVVAASSRVGRSAGHGRAATGEVVDRCGEHDDE